MKILTVALGAILLTATIPGNAATVYGTYQGGEGTGAIDLTGYPDGTSFRFTVSSSAPIVSGLIDYAYQSGFDQYFDVSGIDYGGDDAPNDIVRAVTSRTETGVFTTPKDYTLYYPDGDVMERDHFQPLRLSVDLFSDAPDGAAFQLSVVAVPEAAAWTTMIAGLGLAGGMLRRRRGVTSAAAPIAR